MFLQNSGSRLHNPQSTPYTFTRDVHRSTSIPVFRIPHSPCEVCPYGKPPDILRMFTAVCHILSCWSWIRHVPAGVMLIQFSAQHSNIWILRTLLWQHYTSQLFSFLHGNYCVCTDWSAEYFASFIQEDGLRQLLYQNSTAVYGQLPTALNSLWDWSKIPFMILCRAWFKIDP